jgi:hypothetical protein
MARAARRRGEGASRLLLGLLLASAAGRPAAQATATAAATPAPAAAASASPAPAAAAAADEPAALPAAAGLPAVCSSVVPEVDGVDQSPTQPAQYGACTAAVGAAVAASSPWCKTAFKAFPSVPGALAKNCLKFGRVTPFRGPVRVAAGGLPWCVREEGPQAHARGQPRRGTQLAGRRPPPCRPFHPRPAARAPKILGSDAAHARACGAQVVGSDARAYVTVSSKYLTPKQGAASTEPGACAKCMCLRLSGADTAARPDASLETVVKFTGLTLAAQVGDRCAGDAGQGAGRLHNLGREQTTPPGLLPEHGAPPNHPPRQVRRLRRRPG